MQSRGLVLPSPGQTWLWAPPSASGRQHSVACFVGLLLRHPVTRSAARFHHCPHTRSLQQSISRSYPDPPPYFFDTTYGFLSAQVVTFWSHDLQISYHYLENEKVLQINTGTNLPWIDSHPTSTKQIPRNPPVIIVPPKGKKNPQISEIPQENIHLSS